mgnify:CR=1 FL=1
MTEAQLDAIEDAACPTCGSCAGMFTANSMNCLVEALGLGLPGNGTVLATHADREELFKQAGRTIVDLCKRYYEQDDASVLPRSMGFKAFENAIALDIAMGGSTNTILHILAIAQEAEIEFTMADIDRMSKIVPQLCKVAPNTNKYHIEDVHRAGGIMGILGELDRAGKLHTDVPTVHANFRYIEHGEKRWVGGVARRDTLGAAGGITQRVVECDFRVLVVPWRTPCARMDDT